MKHSEKPTYTLKLGETCPPEVQMIPNLLCFLSISLEIYIFLKHSGKSIYTLKFDETCLQEVQMMPNLKALDANSSLVYTTTLKLGETCAREVQMMPNLEALHAHSSLVYTTTVFKHKANKPVVSLS